MKGIGDRLVTRHVPPIVLSATRRMVLACVVGDMGDRLVRNVVLIVTSATRRTVVAWIV